MTSEVMRSMSTAHTSETLGASMTPEQLKVDPDKIPTESHFIAKVDGEIYGVKTSFLCIHTKGAKKSFLEMYKQTTLQDRLTPFQNAAADFVLKRSCSDSVLCIVVDAKYKAQVFTQRKQSLQQFLFIISPEILQKHLGVLPKYIFPKKPSF